MQGQASAQNPTSDTIYGPRCWTKGDGWTVCSDGSMIPPQRDNTPQWTWFTKAPTEHVIEIKTKREDKKAAIGVNKPAPFPCNVNDGPYLTCITSEITHWSCADKDHELAGGVAEAPYIDPEHPNNPYCIRVTRELWIDGVKWGIIRGLD